MVHPVRERLLTPLFQGEDWSPPVPEAATKIPFTKDINIRIDDVEKELFVLIAKAFEEEKRKATQNWTPELAVSEMHRLLGCNDCKFSSGCKCGMSHVSNPYRSKEYPCTNYRLDSK